MPRPSDEEVFQKNDFHCVYCGFDGSSFEGWKFLQVDHFKPRSKGGTDDLQNLVTSCMICNFMKGANEWTTLEKAKREIRTWHEKMRQYWEGKVKPLLPPT